MMLSSTTRWCLLLGTFLALGNGSLQRSIASDASPIPWQPKQNQVIAIIGNTLADRMQHDAWLDAYLHSRFPTSNLRIRHMGFSGDEVGGFTARPDNAKRLRSRDFGSNDEWLTRVQADVIFAFFGYNEAQQGEKTYPQFRAELAEFLKHARQQKYNGKSAPIVILFGPIAHENTYNLNLPNGEASNAKLTAVNKIMSEIALQEGVQFIDLFTPTQAGYQSSKSNWTINGIHLNSNGNQQLAEIINAKLFREAWVPNPKLLGQVREAAQDRNFTWFNRFRTTDGYSIYGGRADRSFVGGQTNRIVAEREMEILDTMTANRDEAVWARAQGKDAKIDDSNTAEFIPVITNKPGPLEDGKHVFLDGTEAIKKMTLGENLEITLFADEKKWPELINPVQMAWDTKGRLWVATWPTYPHWKPKTPMNDKLLIFEDTNGDGQADTMKIFADNLHNPTGFEFYNGGVLVAQAPDLVFLKDTNGDDKADVRERVIHGLDSADTHHTSNSFVLDPGGALYFQEGTFHHTQVETPYGPPERVANGAVFRYDPRRQQFNVYVTFGFANPHGHVFDKWGQDIVVDGTGSQPYHAPLFSSYLPFPQKHARPPQVYQQRTRPCPGMEYLSSSHFPEEFRGNLLVGNVIGFQGLLRYKIEDDGSSFQATELEPIVSSTDANFRPTDFKVGPDGAIYFIDWQNPIIGHLQHNLRDPSRDKSHGRIYRVTYKGRDTLKPAPIAGQAIPALLELLKDPDDRVRYRTKIELSGREAGEVIPAVQQWARQLKTDDPNYAHHLTEALWVHQYFNIANSDLLQQVLKLDNGNARAAATRVLTYWRDRVPNSLEIFKTLAADPHPRVRLMALWGSSFFEVAEAIEVLIIANEQPKDRYIEHMSNEVRKALDPLVREAIAAGRKLQFTTTAGARYFLRNLPTEDLLKVERNAAVYAELMDRPGLRDDVRREAIGALAKANQSSDNTIILNTLRKQDGKPTNDSITYDLMRILTATPAALQPIRSDLEQLAKTAQSGLLRELSFMALIAADGNADKALSLALQSPSQLRDFVNAVPLIRDPLQRIALYPKLIPLLKGLPKELQSPKSNLVMGRYIRVELPGKNKTLTLAEVEVISDGKNIAPTGKASQSSTSHGGEAKRAIDGNKSPTYGNGGQTHSEEGENDPWWELDLGREVPIESIIVYNRGDGNLGNRLNNYTVMVRDSSKKVLFQKVKQAKPNLSTTHTVSGVSPERLIRQSTMLALTSIRGKEAETFASLTPFLKDDLNRYAALQAIQRIPSTAWPKDQAPELLKSVTEYVQKVPEAQRTTPEVLAALQFGESLAGLMPLEEAKAARKTLGSLGVRIIRLGTVTDQMIFDKDRIVVQAGKPVEFLFENTDIMPHNFAIVEPGSLEEVGNAAEAFGVLPGAQAKNFIPPSKKILLGSKLLQPQQSQNLRFQAPKKAGVYPYVCTYPGHWRRMHGALYVVDDLDAYLANPEGYVAKQKLEPVDELLKFNRPRTEWKLADLTPALPELDNGGRSFARGKQIFTVASCISCHKFDGGGQEFGPDLTKLDTKEFKSVNDLAKHILEPSIRIEDKYKTYTFNLLSGASYTGMVLEKSPQGNYKIIENPLAKTTTRSISHNDMDGGPKASPVSMMPKGLLDKLTKDEILDLFAYVWSKADPKHKYFHGNHDHHQH